MNLVLDEAEEVSMKRKARKPIGVQFAAGLWKGRWLLDDVFPALTTIPAVGRILLKGDNITLMQTTYVGCMAALRGAVSLRICSICVGRAT